MEQSGSYLWLIVVLGGAILLGAAIAYGMYRSRRRSLAEQIHTEAATRDEYAKEDAERPG